MAVTTTPESQWLTITHLCFSVITHVVHGIALCCIISIPESSLEKQSESGMFTLKIYEGGKVADPTMALKTSWKWWTSGQLGGVGNMLHLFAQPQEGSQLISKQNTTRTVRKSNCMEVQQSKI